MPYTDGNIHIDRDLFGERRKTQWRSRAVNVRSALPITEFALYTRQPALGNDIVDGRYFEREA